MSKVQERKEEMGWRQVGPHCGNCKHYTFEWVRLSSYGGGFYEEKRKRRCTLGDFATKERAWCKKHEYREEEE